MAYDRASAWRRTPCACNPFVQTEEASVEPRQCPAAVQKPATAPIAPALEPDSELTDGGGGPAGPQYPTGAELAQATHLTDNTESGTTALVDGGMTISLGKWAIGDIDGSDGFDAAAVTIANPGGSGTLYHLHALVDQDDGLCDLGTAFLGDRFRIESVAFRHRTITVAILDRFDDDPYAATPTRPENRTFRLAEGSLVEENPVSDVEFGCNGGLPDASLVIVRLPVGGTEVKSGFTVRGCSRTFESNVQWQLLARSGEVISSGHTSEGGYDGPANSQFTVVYKVAEPQIASIEVFEGDVSEGEGYPPPRAVVPLILSPN